MCIEVHAGMRLIKRLDAAGAAGGGGTAPRGTIRVCLSDAHRASKVRRVATATADHPLLIGGERVETGEWTDVRSPYSGELVGRIARGGATETRRALDAAEAALRAPLPAHRRAAILDATARLLEERQEEAAQVISAEAGKPLKAARIEAQRAASTYIFAAVEARKLAGDVVPMDASPAGEGKLAITLRVPIGVVGAISPFNFPLNLVAHKIAPALAAGCPVVLKPATTTPLSALFLAELEEEAGLPPGWLNVVSGWSLRRSATCSSRTSA